MSGMPDDSKMLERSSLEALGAALDRLEAGFSGLPPLGEAFSVGALAPVLAEAATRLRENYPYFHPLYAGQMLKPPHPVARAAYALATWINPNNHALDGGRASSAMEVEAVAHIAKMFGFAQHLGHLTSGGTVANLEALWVGGRLAAKAGQPALVMASEQAHYTHPRISGVLGLGFEAIPSDDSGRMDVGALEERLAAAGRKKNGAFVTVVVTFGTTGTGAIDPLPEILELQERYGFRVHVDAAYGGYFGLASTLEAPARAAAEAIHRADSVVIDPHKHGLQPYGCGCVLFADPATGRFYKHDSPYTYFSSPQLHLGEITLECSRAGAAAVALWATQRLLPNVRGAEYAAGLDNSRRAALEFHQRLSEDPRFVTASPPQLDIVCWAVAAPNLEESSRLARAVFDRAAELDLHLALVTLPARFFPALSGAPSGATVTCLRSVLMKPEHEAWLPEIWARLSQATDEVVSRQMRK
jgi:glutamate/tyrosine decarboxylase-like PLP-dependent enzyme